MEKDTAELSTYTTYTIEQVAIILQCCPKTVRKLCEEGRLRSVPLGPRHRRITAADLNEFLAKP